MGLAGTPFRHRHTNHKESRYSEIGNLDAVCSYCNATLDKKPGAKKRCPHCGEYIYVMTRPLDDERVLVTAEQRQTLSQEWSYRHMRERWSAEWLETYDRAEAALSRQFGFAPSRADIFWRVLNKRVFGRTLEGERWFLYQEALDALRHLREEGELDVVEDTLLRAKPTPAVADELRKTLSAKAKLAERNEDWKSVVQHLDSYLNYANKWREHCLKEVSQEPPPLSDTDKQLLEQARQQ